MEIIIRDELLEEAKNIYLGCLRWLSNNKMSDSELSLYTTKMYKLLGKLTSEQQNELFRYLQEANDKYVYNETTIRIKNILNQSLSLESKKRENKVEQSKEEQIKERAEQIRTKYAISQNNELDNKLVFYSTAIFSGFLDKMSRVNRINFSAEEEAMYKDEIEALLEVLSPVQLMRVRVNIEYVSKRWDAIDRAVAYEIGKEIEKEFKKKYNTLDEDEKNTVNEDLNECKESEENKRADREIWVKESTGEDQEGWKRSLDESIIKIAEWKRLFNLFSTNIKLPNK